MINMMRNHFLLQFMGPRYPAGPRPGVRMPQMGNDFNGVSIWEFIIHIWLMFDIFVIIEKYFENILLKYINKRWYIIYIVLFMIFALII